VFGIVLRVVLGNVRFSMCVRLEPQQHFQVWRRCGCSLVGVDFENVAVVRVLGMPESAKTLRHYACAAKSLPGGLRNFPKTRSWGPGEGRERYCHSVFSFQYSALTSGQVGQVTGAITRHLHAFRQVASADC
jgi:hypothetical protein